MPSPAKRPLKRPTQHALEGPERAIPPSKPFLRFYHSDRLRAETLAVLDAIEQGTDPLEHREALANLAVRLMDSGLEYYLLRALRVAKVGFVVEQTAQIAMVGASRVLGSVTRNILLRMDGPQLLAVCSHVRHLME